MKETLVSAAKFVGQVGLLAAALMALMALVFIIGAVMETAPV